MDELGDIYMKFDRKNYRFELGVFGGKGVIWIECPYNRRLIEELKGQFSQVKWHPGRRVWEIPDSEDNRRVTGLDDDDGDVVEMKKCDKSKDYSISEAVLSRVGVIN